MSTNLQKTEPKFPTKELFERDTIKAKFQELLGKKAQGFITSVLQVVSGNPELMKADAGSIYQAAAMAATLDLPINNNLGFAYIVPYNVKVPGKNGEPDTYKKMGQFQLGAKGFLQLAQRSGQFKTISSTDVREGEIRMRDRLTGEIEFNWTQDEALRLTKPIIGYVSYFKLLNGFEKSWYMSNEQLHLHGKTYSKTYDKASGRWKIDFESMALKTVTKLNLSKFAPLSIEMQSAIKVDQAVIKDADTQDIEYSDAYQDDEENVPLKIDGLKEKPTGNAMAGLNKLKPNKKADEASTGPVGESGPQGDPAGVKVEPPSQQIEFPDVVELSSAGTRPAANSKLITDFLSAHFTPEAFMQKMVDLEIAGDLSGIMDASMRMSKEHLTFIFQDLV